MDTRINGSGGDANAEELRRQVVSRQIKLTGGWVSFPLNAICHCGYDFANDPTSLTDIKTGCPNCHKSYCE